MKAQVKFTETQCSRIAKTILNSSFWMAGIGHFSLTEEEISSVLFTCLNARDYKTMERMLTAKYNLWLRLRGM